MKLRLRTTECYLPTVITVLPATPQKWTHPAVTPVRQAGNRFTYPWVDLSRMWIAYSQSRRVLARNYTELEVLWPIRSVTKCVHFAWTSLKPKGQRSRSQSHMMLRWEVRRNWGTAGGTIVNLCGHIALGQVKSQGCEIKRNSNLKCRQLISST